MTLDQEARACYDLCQTPKPDWDQLGSVTQDVWRDYVLFGNGYREWLLSRGVPEDCLDLFV